MAMWLHVSFVGNHIGDDGARALLEAVQKSSSPFLQHVRLHGVQLAMHTMARSIYLGQSPRLSDGLYLRAGNLGAGTDVEEVTEARWQDKIDRAIEERFQLLASASAKVTSKPDRGKSDADGPVKHAGEL
eukprot:COSAG02_NODE_6596_length_3471_cov_1.285884_5_plen_130_part_00